MPGHPAVDCAETVSLKKGLLSVVLTPLSVALTPLSVALTPFVVASNSWQMSSCSPAGGRGVIDVCFRR